MLRAPAVDSDEEFLLGHVVAVSYNLRMVLRWQTVELATRQGEGSEQGDAFMSFIFAAALTRHTMDRHMQKQQHSALRRGSFRGSSARGVVGVP